MDSAELERQKYEKMWGVEAYANHSPAEMYFDTFIDQVQPPAHATVIDLGCGTGRASRAFAARGYGVTRLDITPAGLEDNDLPFIQQPLWDPIPGRYDYGYCCDVMEHIPLEYTMAVLHSIAGSCGEAFFSISLRPDQMGAIIGQPLHLTVMPYMWWLMKMREVGEVVDARDLLTEAIYHVRFQKWTT